MKVAIIGSGIAGNTLAWHLQKNHDITVFSADSHVGGHTHTHRVQAFGREYSIDTGFIVYNNWTYPNFIALMDELGVATQASQMSFSVHDEVSGLEYNGTSLNSLFAQRRNLLRPSFLRMIKDILRFNKEAPLLLGDDVADLPFADYLKKHRYSESFIKHYIIPMGSAIWSASPKQMFDFPSKFFIRFFHNHGMLSVSNRPEWRVIKGGSQAYVEKLTASFRDKIRLNTPIESVRRSSDGAWLRAKGQDEEKFDWVFFACHSDQALSLLSDASAQEREILGALPYQKNRVVLHTDATLMPKRKLAWAAWNYHLTAQPLGLAAVTYNMNILQSLDSPEPFLVTLNHTGKIVHEKIIKTLDYTHPVFSPAGIAAQARHAEISGHQRTAYAGAYWRNGFHEDGVVSALAALAHFNWALAS
ncbi:MAG: FAD-dependent oxidoreductase [Methylotenera sp.]|nr:FAD-dependent oxidoreductase [Methylotenera sp.]